MRPLSPDTPAPDFTLPAGPDQNVSLRDFRGRPVVLVFYPADWSPVCGDQVALYNEILPEFEQFDAQLLGVSVDGPWCHAAFSRDRKLTFPLLADFEPKGAVARRYGVYRDDGTSERALFVIDGDGVIRWSYVSPIEVNPGADGILAALESLSPEGVRPMKLDVKPESAEPPHLAIPVSDKDHAQGSADAPATLVEYGDYECPYCGNAYPIIKRIQKEIGPRRLRFVFRNFPLNTIHAHAGVAAQAAEAAAAQGKFWEMHDLLYEHQHDLADADLVNYALKLGLEVYRFESDLSGEIFAKRVSEDFRGGVRSGVNGTPTFFINGVRYDGPHDYESLKQALDYAIETSGT